MMADPISRFNDAIISSHYNIRLYPRRHKMLFLGDMSPGILSPGTFRRGIHVGEGAKGINSPVTCLGDTNGPTPFSVNENIRSSKIFPGDMSPGIVLSLIS
ncbi:hypothetical protein Tco_0125880 [Tanacetum coccineum]